MIDLLKIKSNIKNYSTEKLCEMIVTARYFKLNNDIVVICMEQLADKRVNGDNFDYESHIDLLSKDLPEISNSLPDIREMLIKAVK